MKKILLFGCIGCSVILLVIIAIVVVGLIWLGSGPEGGVKVSNDMEAYALKYIKENKILDGSEELLAYYDATVSLKGTEAAILTTKRIIYHKNGINDSINLSDIEDIRHRKEVLTGDVIEISSASGKTMKIEIAPMNQGETFFNVLMKTWEKSKNKTRTT
ncbi:MAG TPA: hypothetical protein DCZ94_02960 [Lentisphaeria bacterium]|nr:MAG: hypothetical protein A2X48_15785 [Lentisphaerae bacterium GWF2_49_21]HBC85894.1 hypothetical protein [Lentisphaeria bacterium]